MQRPDIYIKFMNTFRNAVVICDDSAPGFSFIFNGSTQTHTLTLLAYHKPQRKSEHPLHEMR